MKHDLARLETSKKKRKRHDSSDNSEVNTSEEERVLESSDDSHEEDNPTPSLDTRNKSLIASSPQPQLMLSLVTCWAKLPVT